MYCSPRMEICREKAALSPLKSVKPSVQSHAIILQNPFFVAWNCPAPSSCGLWINSVSASYLSHGVESLFFWPHAILPCIPSIFRNRSFDYSHDHLSRCQTDDAREMKVLVTSHYC
ncbi:hypothetical protein VTO42DRAFT_6735 [Malbranchea cinnamomea]